MLVIVVIIQIVQIVWHSLRLNENINNSPFVLQLEEGVPIRPCKTVAYVRRAWYFDSVP